MRQFPFNNGLLNSTYDYQKLIKMQSEEGTEKIASKDKVLKKELSKNKVSKTKLPRNNLSKRR